jgi:16S rRNA (cytosine967-C5)-methyltransferase
MTPGARVAAAIEVLGDIAQGVAAEQALTRWARRRRFAGSKDRAAIRDHVFDLLRNRAMAAHYGQGSDPRQLMIGLLHLQGVPLDALFAGTGHAPQPLTVQEREFPAEPTDKPTLFNLPDWLVARFEAALGEQAQAAASALQLRAPVILRANTAIGTRDTAQASLRVDGIETVANPLADTALTVISGARKVRQSRAYAEGAVELQDASSQAVVALLPPGGRVLDFCAGGGGKALALAADRSRDVFAHDIDRARMADLPVRAERAGAHIRQLATSDLAAASPFDVVLCDAPCSGSGAWRRAVEGKWTLTPERLAELLILQDRILDQAADVVGENGILAYATCSLLREENEDRASAFLSRHPDWRQAGAWRFDVCPDGDGFFSAHFKRA